MLSRIIGVSVILAMLVGACSQSGTSPAPSVADPGASVPITSQAPASGPAGEQRTYAYIPHLTGHPVWLIAKDGWDTAASDMGFEGTWIGSTTGEVNELVAALDASIAQGVDGIAIAAINPSAMQASIDRAVDQGIPVVTILADAADSKRTAFLGSDTTKFGTLAAQGLQEAIGDSGKVAVIVATLDVENQRQILDAFEAELGKTPGLEIVAVEADNSDLATSAEKVGALLTAHPDLKGIFGINANVPIAACQVFKEREVTGVAMIGADDLDETLACIRDGTITGTIAQNFYGAGYLAGTLLEQAVNGETVETINDSGVALVTMDTIDTYKAEFEAIGR